MHYMTLPEVSRLVGVSHSTIISHERSGRLPKPERIGVARVYDPAAVAAIVRHYATWEKWSRDR